MTYFFSNSICITSELFDNEFLHNPLDFVRKINLCLLLLEHSLRVEPSVTVGTQNHTYEQLSLGSPIYKNMII